MYWPLWLLAHYPERSREKQPTAAVATPAFMNGVPFPLVGEGFWFLAMNESKEKVWSYWTQCVFVFIYPVTRHKTQWSHSVVIFKDLLIKSIFKNPSSEIPWRKTWWWSCILAALCVGRRRNVAGLCYGWMFLLYIVNRRECWSFPVVLVCVEFWFNSLPSTVGAPTVLTLATFRFMDHMGRHI